MQQIVYVMQFKGKGTPDPSQAGRIHVTAEAASSSITTVINDGGFTGGFDPAAVAPAQFESTVIIEEDGGFTERGSITLGKGTHRFQFRSVGRGWMGPSPDEKLRQGTVTWQLEGGEGQLSGAGGLITSNFTVDEELTITDYHLGVLYIP